MTWVFCLFGPACVGRCSVRRRIHWALIEQWHLSLWSSFMQIKPASCSPPWLKLMRFPARRHCIIWVAGQTLSQRCNTMPTSRFIFNFQQPSNSLDASWYYGSADALFCELCPKRIKFATSRCRDQICIRRTQDFVLWSEQRVRGCSFLFPCRLFLFLREAILEFPPRAQL